MKDNAIFDSKIEYTTNGTASVSKSIVEITNNKEDELTPHRERIIYKITERIVVNNDATKSEPR